MRVEGRDRAWEPAAVEAAVEGWHRFLSRAGVQAREPIAVEGTAQPEAVFAMLGVRHAGASLAPIHPSLTDEEAKRLIRRIGARLVIAGPHRRWSPSPAVSQVGWDASSTTVRLEGKAHPLDAEYVVFTSGSEGAPKGVLLSEAGFQAHHQASRPILEPTGFDRWLFSLSPAHVGGLALLLRAEHEPGTTLVCPSPDWTRSVAAEVGRQRISHLSLVPTLLRRWTMTGGAAPDHVRLVLVGGAHCPTDVADAARRMGLPIRLTYGLTEAHSQVATTVPGSPSGSVGRPLPCVDLEIESGTGRIRIRGPTRMVGYLGERRLVPRAWLRTGDLGRLDKEGNLWVLGRADDIIVTGGENVDPVEVEAVLEGLPGIREACVVPEPDPEWGQRLVALLVAGRARPNQAATLKAAAARLAPFKRPKRIQFVAGLPRTPNGKLRRAEARKLLDRRDVRVDDATR